jgi:hypothetical protein
MGPGVPLRNYSQPITPIGSRYRRVQQGIEIKEYAMPLIRNENAIPTRRGFSGALFSALLALALFDPSAATAQKHKQIKLTEKHIQGFMGARKDMTKLYDGANPDKPNPKVEVQAEAARKNGFASLDEYDEVSFNILMIMSGIDPQTKKFTEPPEHIKKEIAIGIGRIAPNRLRGHPGCGRWAYGEHEDRTLTHGYEAKRHAAMQAFAPCILRCG